MDKWFDAKMRYTRSVAVSSVVGHILGIGDRHCSNILVHQGTGECIHIDFGIVFEQAKVSQEIPIQGIDVLSLLLINLVSYVIISRH
jgi:phosphatidylinositol kinase/protein kinase (PI-3  family)